MNIKLFPNVSPNKSPNRSPLVPISEIPDVFESKTEAKAFKKFLELIEKNHNPIFPQHNQELRDQIKMKIPPLNNLG